MSNPSHPVILSGSQIGRASNAGQAAWCFNEALHTQGVAGNHVGPMHVSLTAVFSYKGQDPEWRAK